jgi:recombinational DNA repair ATPase RecF
VLWLKFGEFAYLRTQTRQQPLLLLDDILSELDESSRQLALQVVRGCQSIITTTEQEVVLLLQETLPKGSLAVLELERKNESSTS